MAPPSSRIDFTNRWFLRLGPEDVLNRYGRPLAILGDGPGFHSFRDGEPNCSYTGNLVRALGRIEDGDPYIFELQATSTAATSDGNGV